MDLHIGQKYDLEERGAPWEKVASSHQPNGNGAQELSGSRQNGILRRGWYEKGLKSINWGEVPTNNNSSIRNRRSGGSNISGSYFYHSQRLSAELEAFWEDAYLATALNTLYQPLTLAAIAD